MVNTERRQHNIALKKGDNVMTKKKLPVFELLNKYNEETEQHRERAAQYAASVREAEALVQALKVRKDNALKAAVVEGKNNEAELNELEEQLAKAERDLTIAKQKQQVAAHISNRKISLADIDKAFSAWTNQYQTEQVDPAIEEVRKAKEQYVEKYLNLANVLTNYEEQARTVTFTVKPKAITIIYRLLGFGTEKRRKYATISDYDNEQLNRGVMPRSMKDE